MVAPAWSAARATEGLAVSIEIGICRRPASSLMTGMTLRNSSAIRLNVLTIGVFDSQLFEMFAELLQTLDLERQVRQVRLHLDRAAGGEMTKLDQLFTGRRLEEYQFRATGRFVPSHLFETQH